MTEKAIPLYERAYELMKLKLGSTHPDTLASMNNLAGAYYGVGQMEKTIEVFNQALEIMKSKFGPQHPVTLTTMNNLALAYKDTGELEKALPLFEQSLQGIQAINFKSPTASNMLTSSILAFEVTQQYALADHWRTIWQDYLKSEFGDQSDEMAEELEAHGRAMHTRMEFEEAEKIFRRCLQIRITLAPHAWKTIQTQSLLGSALLMQNKLADAEPQLLAGFNGLEPLKSTIPPDATPGILGTLDLLIQLHTALGQEKEIEHYRQLRETHQ